MTAETKEGELAYLTSERSLVDAKCRGFIRNIHLFRFPEKYAQFWRYCRVDFPLLGEQQGEWTDFLTDRMELDPSYSLRQKADWLTEKMNYVFRFLSLEDRLNSTEAWRSYILDHADGGMNESADYRDSVGVRMTAADMLPSAEAWDTLFTGKKQRRLNADRFYDWLVPQVPAAWPQLPEKPTERLILPNFPDFRPFEIMGGVVIYFSKPKE